MAKPYSMDLRERAMARLEAGETSYEVAAALKVCRFERDQVGGAQAPTVVRRPARWAGHRP